VAEGTETLGEFEQTWQPGRGFPGVLSEVNNQPLGKRYMVTAFVFFLLGGVLALLMRVQLAVSDNTFLGPQLYNELFTMHGSTMMFLFAVPFLEGLAVYLLPMMIGSRDVAFPRLTAYGYWVYLFGGVIFYASFIVGAVPDIGWFGYTPLSTERFSGIATDFWLLGLSLVEVAGLTAAVEIVATILKFRAPGMTLGRMPLFIWTMLVAGVMIIAAFSVLLTATVLLELDRSMQTRFFDVHRGGSNLLWQHLFWFFGHPDVYIMFLPATGIVSMVITAFAQRPISGYVLIGMAILVTGFVSFGLWVHHMFAAGLPALSMAFFTAASLMIAIASGVQIFAWIATLWGSAPALKSPLLFTLGFVFIFVLGGLTGVMVAVVPFDVQVHDTYFIVAHFHYVLIGGVLFPILAGVHYWFPKVYGRMLSERLGTISFWMVFLGFNATFFPMHIMGFLGLPRRVYTYPKFLELDGYNLVATGGAFLNGLGVLVLLFNIVRSLSSGKPAGENPWGADSLEWSVSSPPPAWTFLALPFVRGRHPLWIDASSSTGNAGPGQSSIPLTGQPANWRGTLLTDATEARPQAIQHLPGLSYLPLAVATTTTLAAVGVLSRSYILAIVSVLATAVLTFAWLRPRLRVSRLLRDSPLPDLTGLPVLAGGPHSTGWWGMLGFIGILASSVAALLYSYFYLRLFSAEWPQGQIAAPSLTVPLVAYGLLLFGGVAHGAARTAFRSDRRQASLLGLAVTLFCGLVFVVLQTWELSRSAFSHQTNAYGSIFFVISWVLLLIVAIGLTCTAVAKYLIYYEQRYSREYASRYLESSMLYWGFSPLAGLLIFVTLYVSPYVL
jgi:cytochrome c oxidase subunit I+III